VTLTLQYSLFKVYLKALALQRSIIGKFVNNELESIRKEADGHNLPVPVAALCKA